MLTKMKNIRKKNPKKKNYFQKLKHVSRVWPWGRNNQNLKEICVLSSEIIATQTDGWQTTDKSLIPWPLLTESSRAENRKWWNGWPQHDRECYEATRTPYISNYYIRESQLSISFALRWLVLQIIEVFNFSIGYNRGIWNFWNSKFQKFPTSFCEDYWREYLGQVSKLLAALCRWSR